MIRTNMAGRRPFARGMALMAAIAILAPASALGQAALPLGVWMIDDRAAVQIYDCAGLMCGRIVWLKVPRNAEGQLDRDKNNPEPGLVSRELCGLTIIWGLRPTGVRRWRDGWFYNPDDGVTYRLSAHLKSDDVMVSRIYLAVPLLGKTKTLVRVRHGITDGWC